ncbi:MAG TPA: hypothetical protein VFZ75_08055 [Actinomycetota bacterium]|nr:hypothetical protein [Actinomycetota bacterium]
MRPPSGSRNVAITTLSVILLIAIAAFAILVGLQLQNDKPARFDVAAPEGVDCPVGEGTPACFSFVVTNLGNQPSLVECGVTASPGRAAFLNDLPTYTSSAPFEPGVAESLTVKVDAGDGDVVAQPSMVCVAV